MPHLPTQAQERQRFHKKKPSPDDSDDEGYSSSESDDNQVEQGESSFRLEDLAYTRSGDKGNNCNIGKYLSQAYQFGLFQESHQFKL